MTVLTVTPAAERRVRQGPVPSPFLGRRVGAVFEEASRRGFENRAKGVDGEGGAREAERTRGTGTV